MNPSGFGSVQRPVMLRELADVRQIAGEPRRRWFSSDYFDLIVWLDETGAPNAFELSYDKQGRERALAWDPRRGYSHMLVDNGEHRVGKPKSTPLMCADGPFGASAVIHAFTLESAALPPAVLDFVLPILRAYPQAG